MAAWDQWNDDVLPEVGGAPQALVAHHIKSAVIDFLERTNFLRKTTSLLDWPGGAGPKALTNAVFGNELIESNERVLQVYQVFWNGRQIHPKTIAEMADYYRGEWNTKEGEPLYYLQESDSTITLVPSPAAATNALKLRVSTAPLMSAPAVSDDVYNKHREAIAFGAKARLMVMKNKPWTDQSLAAAYAGYYIDAIEKESGASLKGTAATKLVTKPHGF